MVKIVLTGGGTAGHVTPNLALIEAMDLLNWRIDYIGSQEGIERHMIEREGIPYHGIQTGKLRRYWSWQNFIMPFKVLTGLVAAYRFLKYIKPDIVFSKGGFVAVPVVISAWLRRIPVIAHESDFTLGLANTLSFPFVTKLCVAFEDTKIQAKYPNKVTVTGTPIRSELFHGSKSRALKYCGFDGTKPIILIQGGSLGAKKINDVVRESIDKLTEKFHIIHLCGKGKLDTTLNNHQNYFQVEYAYSEMADFLAASDIVISRAGANSIYELLALGKPHILIPLPLSHSRGDQIVNAKFFEQKGISTVIQNEALTPTALITTINTLSQHLAAIKHKIAALKVESATAKILDILKEQLS